MNIEEMGFVWNNYFPDIPVFFAPLGRPQKLVAAEWRPDEDSFGGKIERYFKPNSESPKTLDICGMAGDKSFSPLFPVNPEKNKAPAPWETERFKRAWTKLQQELAGGPFNVIGLFIGLDNEAFIQGLNAAAKKELVSLEDTEVPKKFGEALNYAFGFFDGEWKGDFFRIVVHSPPSLYDAFLYYGHDRYTLKYLDYTEKAWAFKIIEDKVFEKYKDIKRWKVKPDQSAYEDWRMDLERPIRYALERYSDNPYTPAGSVEEIVKNVAQEEKRFPKELQGKKLPFNRKDMEDLSRRGKLMQLAREFLQTLPEEEQKAFAEEEKKGKISLVTAMYTLRQKYPQFRDKLGGFNIKLDGLYVKLRSFYAKGLNEKIGDEDGEEDRTLHDVTEDKRGVSTEAAIEIKEQRAVLIPLFKEVFAGDPGYCGYLENEEARIILQDIKNFCKVLAERDKGTESAKGKHFDSLHLYKNYDSFSSEKESLKANGFTNRIKELRKLAVKKLDPGSIDLVSPLFCLKEKQK